MKKIKMLMAAALLSAVVWCGNLNINSQAALLGDVNCDGQVTLADVQVVLRAALGIDNLSDYEALLADVNRDGRVTLQDAQRLLKASLNIEPLEEIEITEGPVSSQPEETKSPTGNATGSPVAEETKSPTGNVTGSPVAEETKNPTGNATGSPTAEETKSPTGNATGSPAAEETKSPSGGVTQSPSGIATDTPVLPTQTPDYSAHVHSFRETVVEGNCITKTKRIFTCVECGYTWSEETNYGDHVYDEVEEAPTCELYGRTVYTCRLCGKQTWKWLNDKLPTGHQADENKYTIEESIRTAKYTFYCAKCSDDIDVLYFSCGTRSTADATNTAAPVSFENFNRAYIVDKDIYLLPGEKFGVSGKADNDDKISFCVEGANAVSGDSVYSDGITSIYEFTEDGETYQYITGEKYGTSTLVAKDITTGNEIARFTVHVNRTFVEAGKEFIKLFAGNATPENDTQLYNKSQEILADLKKNYYDTDAQIPYVAAKVITEMNFSDSTTDYEKLQKFAAWLKNNVTYGLAPGEDGQHVSEVLMGEHKSYCAGYAKTFQYFCELVDIPVYHVSGYVQNGGPHAWDMVYIDSGNGLGKQWYYADPTNDSYDYSKPVSQWVEEGSKSGIDYDKYSWRSNGSWCFGTSWFTAANSIYGSWSANVLEDGDNYVHPVTGEICR